MSLFDVNDLITVKLYYMIKEINGNKNLVILEDKKAEEMMKDEKKASKVEFVTTKWSKLSWKDQNDVSTLSYRDIDPITGESKFNFIVYRDSMIKKCLKEWDIKDGDNPVPVNAINIDRLPGEVVIVLYNKFNEATNLSEDEEKN